MIVLIIVNGIFFVHDKIILVYPIQVQSHVIWLHQCISLLHESDE
jgi:hypothetical protein